MRSEFGYSRNIVSKLTVRLYILSVYYHVGCEAQRINNGPLRNDTITGKAYDCLPAKSSFTLCLEKRYI